MIHRMNPRFKILSLLMVMGLLFSLKTLGGLLILLTLAFSLIVYIRVPLSYLIRGLRPILYISLFALLIHIFFTRGGVVLIRIGSVTIESAGVTEGLFIVTRLIILVLFTLLVTLTTTPLSLTYGMEFFLKPLKILGLPAAEIAMIMAIALRFIPTLMEESHRLMRAQVARGADFETGSIFRKAKNLVPLIVPLFVGAFRRADDLALAMEARGYRIGAIRTRMYEDVIATRDWAVFIITLILLLAVLILEL